MKGMTVMDLARYIRNIPDFPKPGIQFKDITPLLKEKEAYRYTIDALAGLFRKNKVDVLVGIEARGYIVGAPVAYILGCGFVPVRKQGKLPAETISSTYELEYGFATLDIHVDAINEGEKVVIIDDLLATGGTTAAVIELVEKLGGEIEGIGYVVELEFLHGRKKIPSYPVHSLIKF